VLRSSAVSSASRQNWPSTVTDRPQGQHTPAEPAHDRHQVLEAVPQAHVDDVRTSQLADASDWHVAQQIRTNSVAGLRLNPVNCSQAAARKADATTGGGMTTIRPWLAPNTRHRSAAVERDIGRSTCASRSVLRIVA